MSTVLRLLLLLSLCLSSAPLWAASPLLARLCARLLNWRQTAAALPPSIAGPDLPDLDVAIVQRQIRLILVADTEAFIAHEPEHAEELQSRLRIAIDGIDALLTYPSKKLVGYSRFVPLDYGGLGGQKVVIKAWDRDLSRTVALQIYLSLDTDLYASVMRQERVEEFYPANTTPLSPLRYFFEAGVYGGFQFKTAEFLQGQNLHELPIHTRADFVDLVLRLAESAEQLQRLHAAGMLHLDIKPENLMSTDRGAVIIDSDGMVPLDARRGWAKKLPRYVTDHDGFSSPEVLKALKSHHKHDRHQITVASDVYSFAESVMSLLSNFEQLYTPRSVPNYFVEEFLSKQIMAARKNPAHRPTLNELSQKLRELAAELRPFSE